MPRPSKLHDAAQSKLFGEWLSARISANGIRKKHLATDLGHGSSALLNKYLRGLVVPTPNAIRIIANAIEIPWTTALIRAGYLDVVVRMFWPVVYLGRIWGSAYVRERGQALRGVGKPFYLLSP